MEAFLLLCVFALVVGIAFALARLGVLSSRISALEGKLNQALENLVALEKEIRSAGGQSTPAKPVSAGKKRPAIAKPRRRGAAAVTAAPPSRPVPAPPLLPPAPAAKPSRTREEWEALIGGKLLNRIGALALILGVGFFLQYAFASDWITEPVRVLIGVAIGLGLIAGAARGARRDLRIFAQGLVGAGIAILYLSAYASFNYYHLLSQPLAFLFMSAVTVITFTQAFRHDSVVVALLGWLGGFLTPFLLSTGEAHAVGLFSYLALLDAGLLIIAWRKEAWKAIEPLAMGATYLIYGLWLASDYREADVVPGLLFLVLFWIMFHVLHTARFSRDVVGARKFRLALASLNGILFYLFLYMLIDADHPAWRVPATLVAAILYFSFALAVRRRSRMDGEFLHPLLTAFGLVVAATSIQFKGLPLVQYWSVEALAFTWAGTQWRLRSVWSSGMGLGALAIIGLIGTAGALVASPSEPFTLLLNSRTFTFLLLAASLALSGMLIERTDQPGATGARTVLHVVWCWLLFVLFTVETGDAFAQSIRDAGAAREQHVEFLRMLSFPAVWGACALAAIWGGRWREFRPVVVSGLIMLAGAACLGAVRGLVYVPIADYAPVLNARVLLLLVLIAECEIARRLLGRPDPPVISSGWIDRALQAVIALLVLVVLTGEIWDYFAYGIYALPLSAGELNIQQEMDRLGNLRQVFISAGWLFYSILLMAFGIWRRSRVVRVEAIILFGISILKIFIYDLSFLDTVYRIISFVFLGVILLAVSYLYQRYRSVILGPEQGHAEA